THLSVFLSPPLTAIHTLSLHDALPIFPPSPPRGLLRGPGHGPARQRRPLRPPPAVTGQRRSTARRTAAGTRSPSPRRSRSWPDAVPDPHRQPGGGDYECAESVEVTPAESGDSLRIRSI